MTPFKVFLLLLILAFYPSVTVEFHVGSNNEKEADDCWRCTTKYCREEITPYFCTGYGQCKLIWIPGPEFACIDEYHFTHIEKRLVDIQYEDCHEPLENEAGTKKLGHTYQVRYCARLFSCGCDSSLSCTQDIDLGEVEPRLHSIFETETEEVCITSTVEDP